MISGIVSKHWRKTKTISPQFLVNHVFTGRGNDQIQGTHADQLSSVTAIKDPRRIFDLWML